MSTSALPIHGVSHSFGCIPDVRSPFDLSPLHKSVKPFFDSLYVKATATGSFPASYDLTTKYTMPPVKNQGTLGSCTANAGVTLVEITQLALFGSYNNL